MTLLASKALDTAMLAIVALLLSTAACSSQLNPSGDASGASGGATGAAGSGVGGTDDGASGGAAAGGGAGGGAGERGVCSTNTDCAPGLGCLWACRSEAGWGNCVALPTACDAIALPVCGCDDKSYANSCLLASRPAEKAYDGACLVTPVGNGRDATLVAGVWSGTAIRMVVTSSGATVSFGCMQGTIDQPLIFGPRSFFSGLRASGILQGTLTSGGDGGTTTSAATYALSMDRDAVVLHLTDYSGPYWLLRFGDQGQPSCP